MTSMDDITYDDLPEKEDQPRIEEDWEPIPQQVDEPDNEEDTQSEDVISAFVKEHPAQLVREGWPSLPEERKSPSPEGVDHPLGGMHSQSSELDEAIIDEQTRQPVDEVEKTSDELSSQLLDQVAAAPEMPLGEPPEGTELLSAEETETYTTEEIQPLPLDEFSIATGEQSELGYNTASEISDEQVPQISEATQPQQPESPIPFSTTDQFSHPAADDLFSAPEVGTTSPAEGQYQAFTNDYAQFDIQDVPQVAGVATSPRKIALILSGGGARGAFQVGAEKFAREARGYHWDIIAGVSVGAMNGAMLAMHRYARLLEIWHSISDKQVYTGGFNLLSLVKILFGARSFYGNGPLKKLMEGEFAAGRILEDLRVGAVSLPTGEYVQFTKESLELSKAILASASIPVVWPPVDVSPEFPAMVDGGVRNITPVGDVLSMEPDEIVIINCGNAKIPMMPGVSANVLTISLRTLDIMQNEIFINDMKQFLRINALVKEAEQQGAQLHHPRTGKLYKYYPCQVIEPEVELGGILDFSAGSVQASLRAGVRRAREVLGRP